MDRQVARALKAMSTVAAIARELDTRAYLWGGWLSDVLVGRVLREHSDIDYLTVDLRPLVDAFDARLAGQGWEARHALDDCLLAARREGIKLHLGHIHMGTCVDWKHNGDRGSIRFPSDWLHEEPLDFYGLQVHVVEPELGYVLKTHPGLMNAGWEPRDKDRADLQVLQATLIEKRVDLDALASQVISVGQAGP